MSGELPGGPAQGLFAGEASWEGAHLGGGRHQGQTAALVTRLWLQQGEDDSEPGPLFALPLGLTHNSALIGPL